jgi:hypothetical protein
MDNERRYKTLSKMLIALGIIMSIGGIIALIGGFASMWSLPKIDAKDWLFGAIVGGFNIWIIGVLIGRKHRWNKKLTKDFLYYKAIVAVSLLGHLATSFSSNILLIKDPSLSLNQLFIYMLGGCLGLGISYLIRTRKGESTD